MAERFSKALTPNLEVPSSSILPVIHTGVYNLLSNLYNYCVQRVTKSPSRRAVVSKLFGCWLFPESMFIEELFKASKKAFQLFSHPNATHVCIYPLFIKSHGPG